MKKSNGKFSLEDLQGHKRREDLIAIAKEKKIDIKKALSTVCYREQLSLLQIELVNLQRWVVKNNLRVAIIFEGRDAAGKGGTIKRFKEHLSTRSIRTVALPRPTEVEKGQWYFRRYIKELPNVGEIAFFDRSWYNRAVVEPVMGFCSKKEYQKFMVQVPEFEHMLYEDGIILIKFWFSISKEEQMKRFNMRLNDPLKAWKYSPVDKKGQEYWDRYTYYKELMFSKTHSTFSPWIIVKANNKKTARLESIRYVLSKFEYTGKFKAKTTVLPDPNVVARYYRLIDQLDI